MRQRGSVPSPGSPFKQPLPALGYAAIGGLGLFISIVLLVLYVRWVPWLIQSGVESRVFYLLLIPFGLFAAIFMFGVMNSYATYAGKVFTGSLHLGGPVAALVLAVLGGIYFTNAADTFSTTVRLTDQQGNIIPYGKVILRIGPDMRSALVASNGQTTFQEIPRKYENARADFRVDCPGYQISTQTPDTLARVVTLKLSRVPGADVGTSTGDTFSVTIRAFRENGDILSQGTVLLYLGADTRDAPIAKNGEANFKEIPLKFRGAPILVSVHIGGHKITTTPERISLAEVLTIVATDNLKDQLASNRRPPISSRAPNLNTTQAPETTSLPVRSLIPTKDCSAEDIRLRRCPNVRR